MRRGILAAFGDVPAGTEDGSIAHDQGADGHLILLGGDMRPLEGPTHPEEIGIDLSYLSLFLSEHGKYNGGALPDQTGEGMIRTACRSDGEGVAPSPDAATGCRLR